MTKQEIKDGAPPNATHYDDENWTSLTYFKKVGGKWYWRNNTWVLNWTEYDMSFMTEEEFLLLRKPL